MKFWGVKMLTLEDRCKLATDCLPNAPYRKHLLDLHAELLNAIHAATELALKADAELDSLRKDAARYHFLRSDFSVMGANIDGQHSWAYRRNFSLRGPTLDAAIDAARGQP